jgi:hypothetical protein
MRWGEGEEMAKGRRGNENIHPNLSSSHVENDLELSS